MKQQISLREANQNFSRCVEAVERGMEFVVTRRGKPVAIIGPVASAHARGLTPAQKAALRRLFAGARALSIRKWRREDLYARG